MIATIVKMNRAFRHRLFIFGCIALVVGVVHLGVFFSQVIKDDPSGTTRKQILLQNRVLAYLNSYSTGRDIAQHRPGTNDADAESYDMIKYKILGNSREDTTKASNEVNCEGDQCYHDDKIKSIPGELGFDDSEELKNSAPNFQYPYPPDALKLTEISDKKPPNATYFYLRKKMLNHVPKKIALHNPKLCSLPDGKPPFLLVLVPTVVDHVLDRQTIRNTWGSVAYNGGIWGNVTLQQSVRILFVLGSMQFTELDMTIITQEAQDHGDLLLSDFVDSYRNLSLKIAVGLAWSQQYCPGVNHIVKVDEDTFLFVPKLLALLQRTDLQYRKYVMGFAHLNPTPNVLRRGKWRVDPELYPLPTYPRYVYGHSYVISGNAARAILAAFFRMPFNNNEDALFTGILPVVTGTTRLGHRSFAFLLRHEVECNIVKGMYVSLTSCCRIHHKSIFNAIKNQTCNSYQINELLEPGCKFNVKKKVPLIETKVEEKKEVHKNKS